MNKGLEMPIQLIVPCGHAPELLQAAEKKPPDGVTLRVADRIVGPRGAALAAGQNHSAGTAGGRRGHQRVGIVTAEL